MNADDNVGIAISVGFSGAAPTRAQSMLACADVDREATS